MPLASPSPENRFQHLKKALHALPGLRLVEDSPGRLRCRTSSVAFHALLQPQGLRLEVEVLTKVARNKTSLWNVIHLNNHYFPFGQFYISPESSIALGLLLPPGHWLEAWLPQLAHSLIAGAEAYVRLIQNDFLELDFMEREVSPSIFNYFKTDIPHTEEPHLHMNKASATALLAHVLEQEMGASAVYETSQGEFSIAGEHLQSVSILDTSYARRTESSAPWFVGIRTEVGVLEQTDNNLWVRLNRENYEGLMLAHTVRFVQHKPVLLLQTELVPAFLQQSKRLAEVLQAHNQQADDLLASFRKPYRIQPVLNYNLGI